MTENTNHRHCSPLSQSLNTSVHVPWLLSTCAAVLNSQLSKDPNKDDRGLGGYCWGGAVPRHVGTELKAGLVTL